VLPEGAVARLPGLPDQRLRLELGDGDQLDGRRVPPRARAGGGDAFAHVPQSLGDAHRALQGSGNPACRNSSAVSASGRPTTLDALPSMRCTSTPPAPWMAYAPALSSGSPVEAYQAISASDRGRNHTAVSTTADARAAPSSATPVST